MNCAEDLVHPKAMTHCCYVFANELTGMLTDDCRTKNAILSGHGQYFDTAIGFAVDYRSVEVVDTVRGYLIVYPLLLRLKLI